MPVIWNIITNDTVTHVIRVMSLCAFFFPFDIYRIYMSLYFVHPQIILYLQNIVSADVVYRQSGRRNVNGRESGRELYGVNVEWKKEKKTFENRTVIFNRFTADLWDDVERKRIKTIYDWNMIFTIEQDRFVSDRYQ